jgi:hypothetical protein
MANKHQALLRALGYIQDDDWGPTPRSGPPPIRPTRVGRARPDRGLIPVEDEADDEDLGPGWGPTYELPHGGDRR